MRKICQDVSQPQNIEIDWPIEKIVREKGKEREKSEKKLPKYLNDHKKTQAKR